MDDKITALVVEAGDSAEPSESSVQFALILQETLIQSVLETLN